MSGTTLMFVWLTVIHNCDWILENLPFGHIGQPYLLRETSFWCETSHQEGLIFALSNCAKKINLKNCKDFQLSFLESLLEPKKYVFQDLVTYDADI